jgi:hypothetical protein
VSALQVIKPTGVWIMGKKQVEYSEEIIEQYGIKTIDREIMIPHVNRVSNVEGAGELAAVQGHYAEN